MLVPDSLLGLKVRAHADVQVLLTSPNLCASRVRSRGDAGRESTPSGKETLETLKRSGEYAHWLTVAGASGCTSPANISDVRNLRDELEEEGSGERHKVAARRWVQEPHSR